MTRQGWMTYKCMQMSCGQPARGNHAESTTGKQRTPTRIHYVWSENKRFTWKHNKNVQIHTFELYPLSKTVPSLHIGPDPGLSPGPVSPLRPPHSPQMCQCSEVETLYCL